MSSEKRISRRNFVKYVATGGIVGVAAGYGTYYLLTQGSAADEKDLHDMFDRFVQAQNSHDLETVGNLLWDSPNFLWVTRGKAIWGRDAALDTFKTRYAGTWQLAPVTNELQITQLSAAGDVWSIYVPIDFTIGPPGGKAQVTRFLMNMIAIKTPKGLQAAAILPIQAAQ